jgi:chromatin segregation and condensation protein Rec8/ScpA/Scc1 (kleisin family)
VGGWAKARVVGLFLAVLELVRRGRLATRQDRPFEEIWLERPAAQPPLAVASAPEPA